MYNYFMLVGVIAYDVEVREVKDGKKVVNVVLAVTRDFKNADGSYSKDYIRVSIWDALIDLCIDSLKKGKRIGIKGRISPRKETISTGAVIPINDLIADRIVYFDDLDVQAKEDES